MGFPVGAPMIRGALSLECGVVDNRPLVTYLLRINQLRIEVPRWLVLKKRQRSR
jgi:hypothetical protein